LQASRLPGGILLSNVRILVVDDYVPWMNFVSAALSATPQFQVVGQAANGLTALQKLAELNPDLVVLDIGLPDINGITVAQQIRDIAPNVRILFLTENTTPNVVRAALRTGAQGYVVKSSAARELLPALDALMLNCYFLSAAANHFGPTDGPLFSRLSDA
jgi:DNA-binding NarL/FixJ family response regulator